MLQEGEGEHCHERMAMETLPGSPFEVIEAKFLFQLLMGLLADPSCPDGGPPGARTGRALVDSGEVVARQFMARALLFDRVFPKIFGILGAAQLPPR